MTTPTAYLVDLNSTITPHVAVAVNASTGAPSMLTIDGAGNPISTLMGGGGGGSGNVTNVGTFATTGALQTAFPAASNLSAFANVGSVAPFAMYQSNGTAWVLVGSASGAAINVGTFANGTTLQTAFPAAANLGSFANVGASSPYTLYNSNGTAWVASAGGGAWGGISGTLANQADLAAALNGQTTNTQAGTTYTLALTDAGQNVDMTSASANVVTIPTNATAAFAIGVSITICQAGTGATTIAAAGGVTIQIPASRSLTISAQYETAVVRKVGTDTWRVWPN